MIPSISARFVSREMSESLGGSGGGMSFSLPFRFLPNGSGGGGEAGGGLYGITAGEGSGGTGSLVGIRSGRSLLRDCLVLRMTVFITPPRKDLPLVVEMSDGN